MRTNPALGRQRISGAGPALPLVVERDAGMDHGATRRQENIVDRPVEAAGPAQPGHVPAARNHLRLGAAEHPAPIEGLAVGVATRPAAIENLKASQHPGAFLTAAAELPAPADPVAALDRHRLSAALNRGAGDDRVAALGVDLFHALIRQPEGDQLADAVVGNIPADRTRALGQQLDNAQIGQRIDLQTAQRARDHHAIKAGGAQFGDKSRGQALVALNLFAIAAQLRTDRGGAWTSGSLSRSSGRRICSVVMPIDDSLVLRTDDARSAGFCKRRTNHRTPHTSNRCAKKDSTGASGGWRRPAGARREGMIAIRAEATLTGSRSSLTVFRLLPDLILMLNAGRRVAGKWSTSSRCTI